MEEKTYKACILAAGTGHRLSTSHVVNPAVFPINKKGVISYIIEKFPTETEIVITVGYKKDTIIEYLTLAYPERIFTFVEINPFEGPGTGPGASLYACKEHLQCPFILFTADTILIEEISPPIKNWLGVAHVEKTEPFCTVNIKDGLIKEMIDKQHTEHHNAYVGTAGIADYHEFWESLDKNRTPIAGEIQVTNGFLPFLKKGNLHAQFFTWFDTGTKENLQKAISYFSKDGDKFDFGKMDEFIYFIGNRVIKFYEKEDIVDKKVHRATTTLKGVTPQIMGRTRNFFAYGRVDGTTIYPVLNDSVMQELLDWMQKYVWKQTPLNDEQKKTFNEACRAFYYNKTMSRLQLFYDRTGIIDNTIVINDEIVPELSAIMKRIDWESLFDGLPGVFHGDCNFGNMIIANAEKGSRARFAVIDWRQEIGGLVDYGDIYYDLAKLYGGMIIHFELIKQNQFTYRNEGGRVYFDFNTTHNVTSARRVFVEFATKQGYDMHKIKILTALTFLNMAPLHHDPYNRMLYYFGRSYLYKILEGKA